MRQWGGVVAPNGKVLYKTSSDGEWLESDADISNGAFNGFNEKSSAVEVVIPSKDLDGNDVTSIGGNVFSNCSRLTSVTIPDSVTGIGNSAFFSCTAFESMTIPDSVTSIGSYAFNKCSGLTSVTIPDSVTSIGQSAFAGCNNLTSVTIDKTVSEVKGMTYYSTWGLGAYTTGWWNTV